MNHGRAFSLEAAKIIDGSRRDQKKYQHPQLVCQQLQLLLQQVLFDASQTDQTLKQTTRARADAIKSRDAAKVISLKR